MPGSIYEQFGVERIINAVGYATRVGGSAPEPDVVAAMAQAQGDFIEIDDLQAAASRRIAHHTGAQAGIVTCGAAAALTLAAAACLAGNNPDRMDDLPDVSRCPRHRIIYPALGRYDYEHPIRLSGAGIDAVEYDPPGGLERIESAITPRTAAIGFVWRRFGQNPPLADLADLARRHDLPLIVDAALSLPPTEHLRRFIEQGADLVALSGGKHLGGPQASGLLFGRLDLVRSAWVQMVDMDVRPDTWSLRPWIDSGWISRPPRHGIGRSMKVSKEAIIGLLSALERYPRRDHAGELQSWRGRIDWLHRELSNLRGLAIKPLFPAPNGQPFPVLRLEYNPMTALIRRLRQHRPRIILAEDESDPGLAYIFPMCLRDEDLPLIRQALASIFNDSDPR